MSASDSVLDLPLVAKPPVAHLINDWYAVSLPQRPLAGQAVDLLATEDCQQQASPAAAVAEDL